MSIYILIIFAVFAFSLFVFVRKWHDYSMLFTFAIGCAVNANIFNSITNPVVAGGMVFSIDSILYTLFMFTVVICAKDYDIRRAKILTSSAIAAILVSSFIEFFANLSSFGFSMDLVIKLVGYIASALGTFAGIWLMLYVFKKLEKRKTNVYLSFAVCILIASVINSTIYYAAVIASSGKIENLLYTLIGSYIGKTACIILGEIGYFVNTHYWIPKNLKEKDLKDK